MPSPPPWFSAGFAFVLGAVVFGEVPAQGPLTPEDARNVLREAERAEAPAGYYRVRTTRRRKDQTTETTRITQRAPGQLPQWRAESVTTSSENPAQSSRHLTINNAEGLWEVFGNKAVLVPTMPDLATVLAEVDVNGKPPSTSTADPAKQRYANQVCTIAQHTLFAGELVAENGVRRVRVTKTLDAKGEQAIHELVEDQISAVKKQLSFAKRMLVSAALAATGGLDAKTPVKEVYVIDAEAKTVVSRETFNAGGKSLGQQGRRQPEEKLESVPADSFQVPAGVEQIRPKSIGEAIMLIEDLRAEERKAHRQVYAE